MEYSRKTTSLDEIRIIVLLHYLLNSEKLRSWLHLQAILTSCDNNFLNPAEQSQHIAHATQISHHGVL